MSRPKSPDDEERPLHRKRLANPDARCPPHPKKEWRLLVQRAWDDGWWCEHRRKYVVCFPADETSDAIKVPMSPSGSRTFRNVERRFARAGLPM